MDNLKWRRTDCGWQLFNNRRRMGGVGRDVRFPNMWRFIRADGHLSDMVNLSRAKAAVLDTAERELNFEHRRQSANRMPGSLFETPASPVRQNQVEAL